jgi:hypothetical protein
VLPDASFHFQSYPERLGHRHRELVFSIQP